MTLNDAILAATGGPTVNDGLRAYYNAQGVPYGALPDMERAFLRLQMPTAEGTTQDLWMQYLTQVQGYTGTLNDKLLKYWIEVPYGGVFSPEELFQNGEVGVYFDPSDLSTLFQDATGTIPVTAAGQPVGLMLDKSQGLVLGPELVVNGDFSNGLAGWTQTGWAVTSGQATGSGNLEQDIVTTGSWYQIEFDLVTTSIASITIFCGTGNVPFIPAGAQGKQKLILECIGGPRFIIQPIAAQTLDNISVKLLAGNHASQPTTTKRPILQESGGLYSLKFDGIDDFLSTADIDFSGTDQVSTWTGVQKLQDATRGVLYELGTDTNTVNGTFSSNAPDTDGGTGYWFASRGTVRAMAIASGYPAPNTAVLTAKARISTDTCSLQVNGDNPASTGAEQGINAYSNLPLFLGSRAGTSLFFNGNLYPLVIAGALYDQATIDSMNEWTAQKTGVTLP